ncbi:MAG TPA: SH3-like domain-containing protein [Acidimicrobiia bacterium]|nr:SH3-like domain-containing protein [Acidimicrobiia bacterium]
MTERFRTGDRVRVLEERIGGNPRTPRYVKGKVGTITQRHGVIVNPLDHHDPYPPLYSVVFRVEDLGGPTGRDLVVADLHDEWLEPV